MKKRFILSIMPFLLICSAYAEGIKVLSTLTLSGNRVLKGITQTDDETSTSIKVDVDYRGFVVGAWTANAKYKNFDITKAVDIYFGYYTSLSDFNIQTYYIRHTYPGANDLPRNDEVVLNINYEFDKFTLGGKYQDSVYVENNGKKRDYYEGYAWYDFDDGIKLKASRGYYDGFGHNYTFAVEKAIMTRIGLVRLSLNYSNFHADANYFGLTNDTNIYGMVQYTFGWQ